MRYSVESRDRILLQSYRFLSFAKNVSKNIGKNVSKNLSSKYCQQPLQHAKQSGTAKLKTASKKSHSKSSYVKVKFMWLWWYINPS